MKQNQASLTALMTAFERQFTAIAISRFPEKISQLLRISPG